MTEADFLYFFLSNFGQYPEVRRNPSHISKIIMISHRKCFPREPLKIKCLYRCCKIQKIIIFLMILYFTQKSVLGSSFILLLSDILLHHNSRNHKMYHLYMRSAPQMSLPDSFDPEYKGQYEQLCKARTRSYITAYRFVLLQKEVLFSLLNPKNKVHTKIFLKILTNQFLTINITLLEYNFINLKKVDALKRNK